MGCHYKDLALVLHSSWIKKAEQIKMSCSSTQEARFAAGVQLQMKTYQRWPLIGTIY